MLFVRHDVIINLACFNKNRLIKMDLTKKWRNFMNRLTINLTDEQFQKIKTYAENKSMSLSYYGRTLLDIGLRVEKAVTENNTEKPHTIHFDASQKIWKKLLTWEAEAIFMMRYLIKSEFQETLEQRKSFLKEAQERAALRAEELLNDQPE